MYFVGIDISKYKHDCFITNESGEFVTNSFTIKNNSDGFNELLTVLTSLDSSNKIRIGFEATAHYALNLKLFLEKAHYSFMEFKPFVATRPEPTVRPPSRFVDTSLPIYEIIIPCFYRTLFF